MSFFYDLNKKLDSIRATPEVTHQQLNERDMGKHNNATTGFAALAKKAGGGEKGQKIAGAQFQKMKKAGQLEEEESSEWSKIPVGVIDGPGGYDGAQQRIKDYESGNINRDGKKLPPVVDKSRPADKQLPPVVDKSRPAKSIDEGLAGAGKKIYDLARKSADEISDIYSRNPKTGKLNTLPDRDMKPGETFDTSLERMKDQDRGKTKTGNYGGMKVDPKTGAYVPQPPVNIKADEGLAGAGKKIYDLGKRAASGINKMIGHGSDEEMLGTLRKDVGVIHPTGSKRPTPPGMQSTGKRPPRDPDGEDNEIIRPNDPRAKQANDYFNKEVKEAAGAVDFDKVLDAIAALYGDDMWNNDAMQDLASELEQAGPTDRELDFIIAKGRLPKRLAGIQFSAGDDVQFGESGAPMSSKQKSFAKLAPPAGKITFADKIAGAKKEVDEMLGDVAAEAMRNALSPKQKKIDMNKNGKLDANDFAMLRKGAKPEVDEERSKGTAFDPDTPRASTPKVGSIERGAKHDIKHTATGRMVTRRTDDQGNSVGADDDSDAQDGPRGRGRPKGTKNVSSKAKVFQRKSKLMTKEGEDDPAEKGEYDREGDMALDDIDTIESAANELQSIIDADDNLPEWVQSKINKAMDYLDTARDYMAAQGNDQEPIAEKAVSKQQQKFMGMAHAMQKGEKIKGASKELKTVARTMKPKDTKDFAKTKHKGLPDKVKKKEVDENSEEGRLVTKRTGPGQSLTTSTTGRVSATLDKGKVSVKPGKSTDNDADTASAKDTSTSKSNSMVGKGIYDSMNRELENMIAESMSINMSDSTEGNKSLTVTATDEDAMKLAMILKSAGLGGHGDDMHSHGEQPCDTCGMQNCGCGDVQEAVDENAPDWPTNTEQADNNFGYSGGLNKPKTDVAGDGQTTIPNTAVHTQDEDALRRMMEMAGVKIKNNLGPTSPDIARMSKDEVNSALRSGMNPKVDLGPTSPDIARMSSDEVNSALRSGMSPDISNMDSDSVNAEFGKDSIQRMKEMAGIKEAKKQVDQNNDGKNDFEDIKIARMKASGAIDDKEEKKVDESIFALTNQWKAYKG